MEICSRAPLRRLLNSCAAVFMIIIGRTLTAGLPKAFVAHSRCVDDESTVQLLLCLYLAHPLVS